MFQTLPQDFLRKLSFRNIHKIEHMEKVKKIILVAPRGFCAGVDRAVRTVEEALEVFGAPVYVKHRIVHNTTVVRSLEEKGAIIVETLEEVPEGSVVVFSAHGSPPEHYIQAKKRGLRVIDATCPLVTKVHLEVHRYLKRGYEIVYIGHRGHIEGEGVRAEAHPYGKDIFLVDSVSSVEALPSILGKCVYLTQTTLSIPETEGIITALREKIPNIESPPIQDICYATTNRQVAVQKLAQGVDVVLVVGSADSSNSNRLVERARDEGAKAYLVENVEAVQELDLKNVETIGITAGASAPESMVRSITDHLKQGGAQEETLNVIQESMRFADPLELQYMREAKT